MAASVDFGDLSTNETIQSLRTYSEVDFYASEHSLRIGGGREARGELWKGADEARDRPPHSPTNVGVLLHLIVS